MQPPLTERQREILRFLEDSVRESGRPPTVREIARRFSMASPRAVSDHLTALEKKGYLAREPGRSRNIRLARAPAAIPIVGDVAAGAPTAAIEQSSEALDLGAWCGRSDVFAVRVKGDSMMNAGILDGDLVLVRKEARVENRQIAVAYLDGEATVKRICRTGTGYRLEPENPAYSPILVDAETPGFALAGPVVGVIRRLGA